MGFDVSDSAEATVRALSQAIDEPNQQFGRSAKPHQKLELGGGQIPGYRIDDLPRIRLVQIYG